MNTRRILLIDDEASIAALVEAMFEGSEFIVEHTPRFARGLERCKNNGIAVVVLDLGMSGVDGLDGLKQIRQVCPDIPVIIHSAHNDEILALQAIEAGADDYITKPTEPKEFVRRVAYAIHRSRHKKQVRQLRWQTKVIGVATAILSLFEIAKEAGLIDLLRQIFR